MDEIKELLRKFNKDRDWDQFHSPASLARSVIIEAGELLECFQWSDDGFDLHDVSDEIADVIIYCIMLSDKLDIDIKSEVIRKINENAEKYPVSKCKGSSKKYTKLED